MCLADPAALKIMLAEGNSSVFAGKFGSISTVVRWEIVYHVECVMLLFGFCHYLYLGGSIFGALDGGCVWA